MSDTDSHRSRTRFGAVDGEHTGGGPTASPDGDGWTDNLLRRVRARSEGVDPTTGPEPGAADPDAPGAPPEADPGTRRDPRPVLVTFEDLQGAPAPVAAAAGSSGGGQVVEGPSRVPATQVVAGQSGDRAGDFGPPAAPEHPGAEHVDLGIPGAAGGVRRALFEWGTVIVGAIVMALFVKAFLFQAYYIPSPSMEPTLVNGDRIIVNKLSYELHAVNRGDVVVFAAPPGSGSDVKDLIKRVIALSGETVSMSEGRVRIDGGLLLEPYLVSQNMTKGFPPPPGCDASLRAADTCRVPAGHIFVLGDNRANSKDSRFFGPVPEDSIIGRAFLRVWPVGGLGRL